MIRNYVLNAVWTPLGFAAAAVLPSALPVQLGTCGVMGKGRDTDFYCRNVILRKEDLHHHPPISVSIKSLSVSQDHREYFRYPGDLSPCNSIFPPEAVKFFGREGVCKHKMANLVGTGLRNEVALGLVPCRIDFLLHFFLLFSVLWASEPLVFQPNGSASSSKGCKGDTWETLFQFLF